MVLRIINYYSLTDGAVTITKI